MNAARVRGIVIWLLAIALGVLFVLGAAAKLQGSAQMTAAFRDWGYGPGFMRLIGVLEALGGILLIPPRTSTWGAAVLVAVMIGAAYTHLSTGIGSPWGALVFGLVAAIVGWSRRERALGLGGMLKSH